MQLDVLLEALPECRLIRGGTHEITGIASDSRQVQPGALFVAYRGVNLDGHDFVNDALQRGAAALLCERLPQRVDELGVPLAIVPDARLALAHLASAWYGRPSRKLTLIGVTGTDGKTTTTNLIYHVLKQAGVRAGMISTVNAVLPVEGGERLVETGLHTTTPDAMEVQRLLAEMVAGGAQVCVLEVTSHALVQHRVSACRFDIAVLTNITHEHLDLHGTFEAYREAKSRLFEMLTPGRLGPPLAVLNLDDPQSYAYLKERIAVPSVSYSLGCVEADIYVEGAIEHRLGGSLFTVYGPGFSLPVSLALVGDHNASNCLAALAATVLGLRIDPLLATQAMAGVSGVRGRMERVETGGDFYAIVDFAHTPNALRRALEAARTLTDGQVIAVFGCPGLRDRDKRPMMGRIAAGLADYIVVTADDPRTEDLAAIIDAIRVGLEEGGAQEGRDFIALPDRGLAIQYAVSRAKAGDVVIVLGKGHEPTMAMGEDEYPWDDRQALQAAVRGEVLRTLPTAAAQRAGES